jgi:DNA-binding response OmpR family regulator
LTCPPQSVIVAVQSIGEAGGVGRNVLLIEDEPHIAEAIRYVLSRDGWEVASHADGGDAMEVIRRTGPDVLVLDVMLPGRSGYEILADLRRDPALAALPVLVLTARGFRDMPEGATRVMAKPFANTDMVSAVRAIAGTIREAG